MRVSPQGLAVYRRDSRPNSKPLSREAEAAIAKAMANGDRSARESLILANTRFAWKRAAWWYRRLRTIPFEDILQEANLGLVRAADAFDPGQSVRFTTYSLYWIDCCIRRSIGRYTHIHIPDYLMVPARRLRAGRDDGSLSGIQKIDLIRAMNAAHFGDDEIGGIEADEIVSAKAADPPDEAEWQDEINQLGLWIDRLPERYSSVLRMRYGIGKPEENVSEIGASVKLSRARIGQIIEKAILKLRDPGIRSGAVSFDRRKTKGGLYSRITEVAGGR